VLGRDLLRPDRHRRTAKRKRRQRGAGQHARQSWAGSGRNQ
jgi:hypothetical protein